MIEETDRWQGILDVHNVLKSQLPNFTRWNEARFKAILSHIKSDQTRLAVETYLKQMKIDLCLNNEMQFYKFLLWFKFFMNLTIREIRYSITEGNAIETSKNIQEYDSKMPNQHHTFFYNEELFELFIKKETAEDRKETPRT